MSNKKTQELVKITVPVSRADIDKGMTMILNSGGPLAEAFGNVMGEALMAINCWKGAAPGALASALEGALERYTVERGAT